MPRVSVDEDKFPRVPKPASFSIFAAMRSREISATIFAISGSGFEPCAPGSNVVARSADTSREDVYAISQL